MNAKLVLTALATIALSVGQAVAQGSPPPAGGYTPSRVGAVKTIEGPLASVIVVRGAQTYALRDGDALFEGDRIITRSNGRVNIAVYNCEKALEPTASIVLDDQVCGVAPVTVAGNDPALGLASPPSGPPIPVAATPAVVMLLAGAGGAASALSSSNSSTSSVE